MPYSYWKFYPAVALRTKRIARLRGGAVAGVMILGRRGVVMSFREILVDGAGCVATIT